MELNMDEHSNEVVSGIRTALSTQILIQAKQHESDKYITVGAIKSFTIKQTRNIETRTEYDEQGKLQTILVPTHTIITLEIIRAVFDGLSLPEAFGSNYRFIDEQKWPFDVKVITNNITNGQNDILVDTFYNCWFKSFSAPIKADDYLILENATMLCEGMTSERQQN
jgi:hypothetical protein